MPFFAHLSFSPNLAIQSECDIGKVWPTRKMREFLIKYQVIQTLQMKTILGIGN